MMKEKGELDEGQYNIVLGQLIRKDNEGVELLERVESCPD